MPVTASAIRDVPERDAYIYGFSKGVNKLQDESLIDDHELSDHKNGILVVDGVQKRTGTLNFGSSSGSRVYGGTPFYTSASTNNSWIIREGGTSLMYYNGSNVPTAISGATMTTGLRTEFAMARDTLYVQNGTDSMTSVTISGGVPVASQATALTTPTNLAVTPTGSAGSTAYSYRVSAYSASGETLACTSVATATGNATLSSSNYNALTWTAVSNAVGYIIYGRKNSAANGIGETKLSTVTTNAYNDTGVDTPSLLIQPQDGNSTTGAKGTIIKYAQSRLFVAGDSSNPSRLYYSAGGTQITDFSSAYGGGFVDVAKNDGDVITAIEFYQNHIIVWKKRSTWQFDFTSAGLPQLQLITNAFGCESQRTVKIVNNDVWFLCKKDGKATIISLGNVVNYTSSSLRTTQQSLKIENGSYLDSANLAQLSNACAAYYRNLYILCVPDGSSTTNSRCFVYDTRFGSWVGYWDNINANAFFSYIDPTTGQENLYYCSETTGYIVKMFTGTDDNGTAVAWKLQTKSFNQGYYNQYKIFRNPGFWFKDVSNGSVTGYIYQDGIVSSGNFTISPIISGIGAGFDRPGVFKAGTSLGASTTTGNSDQPMEVITTKNCRSIKFELDDTNNSSSFKFLALSYYWTLLPGKPLPATNRTRF